MERRLTNTGFNTQAQVQDLIRSRERIHWFFGLRESEEFIRSCSTSLEETRFELRKHDRHIRRLQLQQAALESATDPMAALQKEDFTDRLDRARRAVERLQPMIRDAMMELRAAEVERDRIVAAHPEVLELSYEALQTRITPIALKEKQAHFLASRVIAATRGLPESVGELLTGLDPDVCDYIGSRALELRDGVSNQLVLLEMAQKLAAIAPAERHLILEQAIALVQQRTLLEANYGSQPEN